MSEAIRRPENSDTKPKRTDWDTLSKLTIFDGSQTNFWESIIYVMIVFATNDGTNTNLKYIIYMPI